MLRSGIGFITLCMLLTTLDARAEMGNYRRNEVIKLAKVESWSKVAKLHDWKLGAQQGMVVAVSERANDVYNGTAKFKFVFVPSDKARPVKLMTAAQTKAAGLRTISEARKLAVELKPGAEFAWALPLRNARLYATTSHHTKHQGTGLSYLFAAHPSQAAPAAAGQVQQIGLGVPMLRSQTQGQTAFVYLP